MGEGSSPAGGIGGGEVGGDGGTAGGATGLGSLDLLDWIGGSGSASGVEQAITSSVNTYGVARMCGSLPVR